MGRSLLKEQTRALADFRFVLRRFILQSDKDAHLLNIEPQQYLLLLHIAASSGDSKLSEQHLADRLGVKHNSVVELIDRATSAGLVKRDNMSRDLRKKTVRMTKKGKLIINKLIRVRLDELERSGPQLIHAISSVLSIVSSNRHQSEQIQNEKLF